MNQKSTDGVLIEAEGIAKKLGDREVLIDASLAVHAGEVVTLIGPNGAGKSTLIRILLGLLKPDRGRVDRRPGLTIGYLPQRFEVDAALPVNVERFLALTGTGAEGIGEALGEVGLEDSAHKQLHALSGGELRRVLLARALVRKPDLLVLDEPLQGVDVAGQADLYRRIGKARRASGAGVVLVSHDLHLVMAESDRVICLNHHVCCAGRPEAVSRDPQYLALFGPTVAVYTHSHDHRHDHSGEVIPSAGGRDRGPAHGGDHGQGESHG